MSKYRRLLKTKRFLFSLGIILGALAILAVRFATYNPDRVHYHANFAVYINGQQEKFEGPRYYEETEASSCSEEHVEDPLERAHMHGNVSSVVHVEDHLVTWGNFFQNIGWGIGDDYLKTADKIYSPTAGNKLTFTLNGKNVESITNLIIGNEDKLLVSYGNSSSEQLEKQYSGIQNQARKYNTEKDPAGCSSNTPINRSDRFKHMF